MMDVRPDFIDNRDGKYGSGRLIDLARAEPVMIAKHGRPIVVMMSVEETRRELDDRNAFLDPNVADEEGRRLRMPGRTEA